MARRGVLCLIVNNALVVRAPTLELHTLACPQIFASPLGRVAFARAIAPIFALVLAALDFPLARRDGRNRRPIHQRLKILPRSFVGVGGGVYDTLAHDLIN